MVSEGDAVEWFEHTAGGQWRDVVVTDTTPDPADVPFWLRGNAVEVEITDDAVPERAPLLVSEAALRE